MFVFRNFKANMEESVLQKKAKSPKILLPRDNQPYQLNLSPYKQFINAIICTCTLIFFLTLKTHVLFSDDIKCLMAAWGYLVWIYHSFVFVFSQFPMNRHLSVCQCLLL